MRPWPACSLGGDEGARTLDPRLAKVSGWLRVCSLSVQDRPSDLRKGWRAFLSHSTPFQPVTACSDDKMLTRKPTVNTFCFVGGVLTCWQTGPDYRPWTETILSVTDRLLGRVSSRARRPSVPSGASPARVPASRCARSPGLPPDSAGRVVALSARASAASPFCAAGPPRARAARSRLSTQPTRMAARAGLRRRPLGRAPL